MTMTTLSQQQKTPLTFVAGTDAEPAAAEHATMVRRLAAAEASLRALTNGAAERHARSADTLALASSYRDGTPDPGTPAVTAWTAEVTAARREFDGLSLAVAMAHGKAQDAAAAAAPAALSVLANARANSATDLEAAVDAAAAAVAEIERADHHSAILAGLAAGEPLTGRLVKNRQRLFLRVPLGAATDDGRRAYLIAPDAALSALRAAATPAPAADDADD